MSTAPSWKDKALFTPGPLTTSRTVKQAMLRDLGSRDFAFIEVIRDIRRRLLDAGEAANAGYDAIPMQGSGTFSIEAVFASTVRPGGKVLIVVNGAYGQRMAKMCRISHIDHETLECPENSLPNLREIGDRLKTGAFSDLAVVHCETTTGIINPIREIGALARAAGVQYFVDAMSSFGAVPFSLAECHIDYLVSSANKCIEGVPGFGFVIARRAALDKTEGWARSLSLDLLEQVRGFEKDGQFRFTPPTHVLLAFHQALLELEQEGGPAGRGARYRRNHEVLVKGMRALGFREYLPPELQGYIITSFLYPDDPKWSFETFYRLLNDRDCVIYPGKVSNAACFRIGTIGRLFEQDMLSLLAAIRDVVETMGLRLAPQA
ncbi:MAG: 2-aminoethylphosphonate--pyruvate transaminase [Candidatus Hydrogenedentes bacterium]|nr:2-aminoethylphosphonate--pyruvate transaminase [Candidatus Hydrogenedentota bacterium]